VLWLCQGCGQVSPDKGEEGQAVQFGPGSVRWCPVQQRRPVFIRWRRHNGKKARQKKKRSWPSGMDWPSRKRPRGDAHSLRPQAPRVHPLPPLMSTPGAPECHWHWQYSMQCKCGADRAHGQHVRGLGLEEGRGKDPGPGPGQVHGTYAKTANQLMQKQQISD
jgi:hypothetical protein